MFLTLIGMSGSGKSFWSKRLAYEQGYRNFYCDDLIEQKLRNHSPTFPGKGIGAVASWLGYPSEATFAEREREYLQNEVAVMHEILASLPLGRKSSDIVIDTSGSVIYTGPDIQTALRNQTTIVYLRIPESEQHALLDQFLRDPKPVLWNGLYRAEPGEDPAVAIRRCYPVLLEQRVKQYEALSHVSIELPLASRGEMSTERLLEQIKAA